MAVLHMHKENVQYSPYLRPNSRNFRAFKEIGVEEHDCDVKFKTGSRNMAVLRMRREMLIN